MQSRYADTITDGQRAGEHWFVSVADVRRANADAGFHWFDADTLAFFRSRIGRTLYGGRWFVTSEEPHHGGRRWTVRRAEADGSIETEGAFMAYESNAEARRAAMALAKAADLA